MPVSKGGLGSGGCWRWGKLLRWQLGGGRGESVVEVVEEGVKKLKVCLELLKSSSVGKNSDFMFKSRHIKFSHAY